MIIPTMARLVADYLSWGFPLHYTKQQAVHEIVAHRLSHSCNYIARSSRYGKGNKAARREAVVRSFSVAPQTTPFQFETYHPMKRRINFHE